jgi:HEAT repeat protein
VNFTARKTIMSIHRRIVTGVVAACILGTTTLCSAQQAPPIEGDEPALIAILESDAPLFQKAKACQQLAVIGTKAAVPALAKYLPDEQLSHYARFGLEPNPDPSTDVVLRASLGELRGRLLVGVINTIGMRRDENAIPQLKTLLASSDREVAGAAAAALGRIASPQSVKLLLDALRGDKAVRVPIADACLAAADMFVAGDKQNEAVALYDALRKADIPQHIRLAALNGAIRARGEDGIPLLVEQLQSQDDEFFGVGLSMAHRVPGSQVTEALVAELAKPLPPLPEGTQLLAILKAEYGADEKWLDVTDAVIAAVGDDGLSIVASNDIAGDPINGVKKSLRVSYQLGGEVKTAVVPEGATLRLEGTMLKYPRQARIISVLAERGDKAALPIVLETAKSGPWDVRLPAVQALARLGDASAVPLLLETAVAQQGPLAAAALDSLAELPGEEVNATLARMLANSEGAQRLVVIELLGRREVASSVPALFQLVESPDKSTRDAAIAALGLTVGLDDLASLARTLIRPPTPDVAEVAKEALKKACLRMPDRAACATILIDQMADVSPETKVDLLDLLGVVGGPKALAFVGKAARDDSEEIQDAATRVLGQWMSADAADVLLVMAKSGNEKFRVRTLRGYIRIARQLDVPLTERLAMCKTALQIASRDAERALVLDTLSLYPTVQSLGLVTPYLGQSGLEEAASKSAVAIAEKILKSNPAAVAPAMKKVLDATEDPELAGRARRLMNRANRQLR